VTMIGVMTETDECVFFHDTYEKNLLIQFWGFVSEHTATYVGFNILTYDWVYLVKRSIVLGVKPYINLRRWMLDLRNVIDSDKYSKGTLGGICSLINGEHKFEGLGGEEVIKLFYDGNYKKLEEYLRQDLLLTKILYIRLQECGLI